MDSLKLCSVAVIGVCAAMLVKQWKSDLLPILRLAITVLLAIAAFTTVSPAAAFLSELIGGETAIPYGSILFKALGIAVLTQCAAEVCRECGEGGAASGVELIGKAEILLLCLPLINDLLSEARTLLSMGV